MSLLPRKTKRIVAQVPAARNQAARARDVLNTIGDFHQSIRNVAADAQIVYRARAPKRSGRLARGITVVRGGEVAVVNVRAIDRKSGYDYVTVSRVGHRKRYIFPTRGKYLAFRGWGPWSGGNSRRRRGWWYLSGVRGFRPKVDWVQTAFPEIKAFADREMEKTGNKVTLKWGG